MPSQLWMLSRRSGCAAAGLDIATALLAVEPARRSAVLRVAGVGRAMAPRRIEEALDRVLAVALLSAEAPCLNHDAVLGHALAGSVGAG